MIRPEGCNSRCRLHLALVYEGKPALLGDHVDPPLGANLPLGTLQNHELGCGIYVSL